MRKTCIAGVVFMAVLAVPGVSGAGPSAPASGAGRPDVSSTLAGNGSGSVGTTNAYIVDTGISAHADLNLVAHGNWTGDGKNYDCNGHGTHVAGTVGARDDANHVVGAAPGVAVIGPRSLAVTAVARCPT